MMRPITVDHGALAGAARRAIDGLEAIHVAIARAQIAVGHVTVRLFGPLGQGIVTQQLEVGGLEGVRALRCIKLFQAQL